MRKDSSSIWKQALRNGFIAGGVAILVSLVGLVEAFGDAYIIRGLITVGELILLFPVFLFAYLSIRGSSGQSRISQLGMTALIGLVAGLMLTLLVILGSQTNMREMFVNASPALFNLLTRGVPFPLGALSSVTGIAALISWGYPDPERSRKPITQGLLGHYFRQLRPGPADQHHTGRATLHYL
jgi:hypothetical protein